MTAGPPPVARRRRELPRAEGQRELPGAAGGAHRHRVEDRLRAAVLQRPGPAAEHGDPVVPVEHPRARSFHFTPREFFDIEDDARGPGAGRRSKGRRRCTNRSRANKRKTFLLLVLGRAVHGPDRLRDRLPLLLRARPGSIIAVILAIVLSLGSYFYGDRVVLASTRAQEGDAGAGAAAAQHRRGHRDRGRACPSPRSTSCPRWRRTRSPPAATRALLDRRHAGSARHDEPGRARGRDRPRDVARPGPRHPDRHGRRDGRRRRGPDVGDLHAVVVLGRRPRPARLERRRTARGRARADPVRGRHRAADHRAARGPADQAVGQPQPRVPRRRGGRRAHPLPAGPDLGAGEDRGRAARDARAPTTRPRTCGSTSPRGSRASETSTMEKLFSTHPPIQERIKRLQEM